MPLRLKLITALVALLFAGLGLFLAVQHDKPLTPAERAVQDLFALSLPNHEKQTQKLEQWRRRPLLINFWATWCAPCVDEIPELSALQKELGQKNLQILGIGIDKLDNIAEFQGKHQIGYPLYGAGFEGAQIAQHLGNGAGGLPFTVLISADERVFKVYSGRLQMSVLRQDIQTMLDAKQ